MLPILEIPRRRRFLTTRIGTTVRELFGRDQTRPLPPVRFLTAADAAREKRPPTSFYNFATGEVGLYYDEELAIDTLWARLTWHSLHEFLHWCLNFSPHQSGARDRVDATLLNIVADAANEQRAGLVSEWCRDLLRRGRRTVLDEELAGPLPDSPLWAAAWLSLRAHTLIASRGWRLLERAADPDAGVTAEAVWGAIEPDLGPPPAHIAERWPDAWRLLWQAWRADNQHVVYAAVRALRELFPESEDDEIPDSGPGGADDHPGSSEERPDVPPGVDTEAASAGDDPAPAEAPAEAPPATGAGEDEDAGSSAPARPGSTASDLRADLDDAAAEEQTEEPVKTEIAELLEDPRMWAPLARMRPRPRSLPEDICITSGSALLMGAGPDVEPSVLRARARSAGGLHTSSCCPF